MFPGVKFNSTLPANHGVRHRNDGVQGGLPHAGETAFRSFGHVAHTGIRRLSCMRASARSLSQNLIRQGLFPCISCFWLDAGFTCKPEGGKWRNFQIPSSAKSQHRYEPEEDDSVLHRGVKGLAERCTGCCSWLSHTSGIQLNQAIKPSGKGHAIGWCSAQLRGPRLAGVELHRLAVQQVGRKTLDPKRWGRWAGKH